MMRILILLLFGLFLYPLSAQQDLMSRADTLFSAASYNKAFDLYKEASLIYQSANSFENYAFCHLKMAQCHLQTGALDKALSQCNDTYEYIADILPEANDLKINALLLKSETHLKTGRNDLALEALLEAESLIANTESLLAAQCYNDLGVAYWNNKNRETAKSYHSRALKIREKKLDNNDALLADSYLNLGLINMEEDFLQSVIHFNNALQIYQEAYGVNHPQVALCYSNLAFTNSNQKNYGEALRYLDLTMDIWKSNYEGDHPNKAFTLSNKGRILESQGAYDEALLMQQEALQQYLRLYGDKHPEVANTYFLIGSVQMKQNGHREAVEHFQKSIYANLLNQSPSDLYSLPQLEGYYNADILLSSLEYKAQALEALHFEKTLNPKDIKSALKTYLHCDDLISQIRQKRLTDDDKIRIGKIASDVYENGIRIALYLSDKTFQKREFREVAFTFCERSKSAVLLEAINETQARQFAGIPGELLSSEDSLKSQISLLEQQLADNPSEPQLSELQNALFETRQQYHAFIDELETAYPNYYDLKYKKEDISLTKLQAALSPSSAVLSYFIGKESIYVFVVTQDDFKVWDMPKSDKLLQLTKGLRNGIKYRIGKAFQSSSRALHDQLIPELRSNIRQLTIIPDGILGTIPFESLITSNPDEPVSYLLETYSISYDYAASLLMTKLLEKPGTSEGILLAAPVDFSKNEIRMANLPGSEEEVRQIRYLFLSGSNKPEVILKADASEARIKKGGLENYKYLHLATHGIVNESKPELSRIFLSPGQQEDGSLYSGEIYNLRINADLVTLSACQTGLGKVEKGEGIIGLSRSLMYAGARNLVVSLWQVSDASTAELMIEFYRQHLHHTGNMIFSDDLRKAKLSLIKSAQYSDPYYWAPFILIGR